MNFKQIQRCYYKPGLWSLGSQQLDPKFTEAVFLLQQYITFNLENKPGIEKTFGQRGLMNFLLDFAWM